MRGREAENSKGNEVEKEEWKKDGRQGDEELIRRPGMRGTRERKKKKEDA